MKKSNIISSFSTKAKGYCIVLFVLMSGASFAQTQGRVTVTKDPRIDSLMALRIALSKNPNNNAGVYAPATANGYRVQIYTGSDRNEAYNAQSKFNELHPDLKTYIIYIEPNFKVRAGDFRTRLEASKLMEQLRPQFSSLFIISDKINLQKAND
jgi:hypothetical protein